VVTWLGFIGKMVEFMATKLLGSSIDLSLDRKRKAARTFLRLHHILKELEAITLEIHEKIGDPNRDYPLGKGAWLFNIDQEVTRLSNEFLHLALQLEDVLGIYDLNLAASLNHLRYSKFSMLAVASDAFRVLSRDADAQTEVRYSYPDLKLVSIDFEQHYNWLLQNPKALREYIDTEQLEWPQSALIGYVEGELIHDDSVRRGTGEEHREDAERLCRVLREHASIVSNANEQLREFIAKNFELADVLY
jgi:hypothetical protein